jgi:arginyl-tRNA synthetase
VNVRALLNARLESALADVLGADASAVLQPAARPEFGDYQANGIMGAAKRARRKPRELAEQVLARARLDDITDAPEIAGPGFINLRLSEAFLSDALRAPDLLEPVAPALRVVVDYSSPNLAKEMHVGHLRSTIIGDALARTQAALGHHVIRQNHVGDWGTQFGMLLAHLEETGAAGTELADLEAFYRAAKARFDADPEFAERSRATVVRLQQGEASARAAWTRFIDVSLSHCQTLYDRLGVGLTPADVQAESAYNDDLAAIVADLELRGLARDSDGALCVFLPEFVGKAGEPLPVIVRKSDGGFLYATTDLAAVRYRADVLHADRVLYLTDARQALHFRQIFAVAHAAGYAPDNMRLEHLPFGAMLGHDGRPFRTRAGDVVKLVELVDEAETRAFALVTDKSPDTDEQTRRDIARAVGVGAIKYADLSKNRTSDYVFDWDQMLSFEGNTAPYLQYACTRIRSVFRRAGRALNDPALAAAVDLRGSEAPERGLAVQLVRFQETVELVAADGFPHLLCGYLYELATLFMRFYEACPILTANAAEQARRLALAARTGQTLERGLELLGIPVVERM